MDQLLDLIDAYQPRLVQGPRADSPHQRHASSTRVRMHIRVRLVVTGSLSRCVAEFGSIGSSAPPEATRWTAGRNHDTARGPDGPCSVAARPDGHHQPGAAAVHVPISPRNHTRHIGAQPRGTTVSSRHARPCRGGSASDDAPVTICSRTRRRMTETSGTSGGRPIAGSFPTPELGSPFPPTGLVIPTQICQHSGEAVGRAQSVGVVLAQNPA